MNGYKDKTKPNTFTSAAIGCGLSLLFAIILTAVSAAVAAFSEDPKSFAWLGRAVLFICGCAAGFVSSKLTGDPPFFAGMLGGAMYIATVVIASLLSRGGIVFWYVPVTLGCSAVGAVAGSVRRDRKTRLPDFDSKKYVTGSK